MSIIICTCNRAESLRHTLAAIDMCSIEEVGNVELLIVDNASKDNTREVTDAFMATSDRFNVRYLYADKRGKGHAYNAGIEAARGAILIFTDDDVRPTENWIQEHYEAYLNPDVSAVQGSIEVELDAPEPAWMEPIHRSFLAEVDKGPEAIFPYTTHLVGANMSFRKSAALSAGPFNVLLGPGRSGFWDESEFSQRMLNLGCKFAYQPAAQVRHIISADRLTREYYKDMAFRQGVSCYIAHAAGTFGKELKPLPEFFRVNVRQVKLRLKALLNGKNYDATQDHMFYIMHMGVTWAYLQGMDRLTARYTR